jgi:hypothetical protein
MQMGALERRRSGLAAVFVALLTVVALLSAWRSGRDMWRYMAHEYAGYSTQTAVERRRMPVERVPLPGDVFDWYAERVHRGDRIYLQIQPGRARRDAVEAAARFYLLPAVIVTDLADANVIVSFYEDPATLGARLLSREQAGLQPIFVSRIEPSR